MNKSATCKSAHHVRSDRSRFAPCRRGRANRLAHRQLFLEALEGRVLLAAGDLDPTFGDGGLVTTDFGYMPGQDYAADVVALQADGKIVVVGRSNSFDSGVDFALARYNGDGSLDTSFGIGGKVVTNFYYDNFIQTPSDEVAHAVAIDGDGKIVVVGFSGLWHVATGYSYYDFALARYNSDGSLDTSFDGDGKVTTDFGGGYPQEACGVAIQTDGKIVVVGTSSSGSPSDFALARYNSNGSLDTSFDGDGKVTTDWGGDYGVEASGLAIQADGKIVVVGTSASGSGNDFVLARYNSDGSLDTDFDPIAHDGKVTTDFGSSDFARSVAIYTTGPNVGKIVVTGSSSNSFAVASYQSDGSLDTDFDPVEHDGMVTIAISPSSSAAHDVTIDGAGRIVVAGQMMGGRFVGVEFALARLNGDGSLDTSFDPVEHDGIVITGFDSIQDNCRGVFVYMDGPHAGKIVVAGSSYQGGTSSGGSDYDFALARYNSDGSLDTSFDPVEHDGKVTTDIGVPGTADRCRDIVAVQPDGKIIVVGSSKQGSVSDHRRTNADFALARYDSEGNLDTTFGLGGLVRTNFNYHYNTDRNSQDYAQAVAVYDDGPNAGKIVVAGYSDYYPGYYGYIQFALARYNSDGSLDTSFGDGGKVTTDFNSSSDYGEAVAIDPAGNIVVVGRSGQQGTGYDFALARYNSYGTLDHTFGINGRVLTDFAGRDDEAYDVVIDTSGKIVVAGYSDQGGGTVYDFALARYNPDGSLDDGSLNDSDPSDQFGVTGKVTVDFASADDHAYGLEIQSDGAIVVAGDSYQGATSYDFSLVRLHSNGSVDTTFGNDGKVTTHFSPDDHANDLAIDGNDRIVVVGHTSPDDAGSDFALARYNPDGSLDTTFGTGGKVTTDFGSPTDSAQGVAIDGNGKIVVAGYSDQHGSGEDIALARYDAHFGVGETIASSAIVEGSTEITVSAIFTDPNTTHTHTAVWDWGDGTTSPGVVTEPSSPGLVTGSHAYAAVGVYAITLTVNATVDGMVVDADQSVFEYVVVFDPSAGFVTGGGTLDSPAGAWTADPALTGRANFGFVSRYQKGANTPDGHTVFRFNAGDLDFRSSSYQWLVVAGANAKFKGTGTIGGNGDYGFMITATDGGADSIDQFRIKIWDAATSEVVYDNELGEADDCYAGTAITSGNIIVHSGGKKLVADSAASQGCSGTWLTAAALQPVVSHAISYWGSAGCDGTELARLQSIEFHVADFADDRLGMASSSTNIIWIDRDAAGAGWQTGVGLDGTASMPSGYDLLTVVTHELGHVLELEDLSSTQYPGHVMSGTLVPGSRRVSPDATSAPWICLNSPPLSRSVFEAVDKALEDDFTRVDLLQPYEQLDTLVPAAEWHQQAVDSLLDEADWTSHGLIDKTTDDEQLEVDEEDLGQCLAGELVTVP